MTSSHSNASAMTDAQKSEHIKSTVLAAGVALRERHRWLRHQDAIGAGIMIFPCSA